MSTNYDSPVMLASGLTSQIIDDYIPPRRHHGVMVQNLNTRRDVDALSGFAPDPLESQAACRGQHELFDTALDPFGKRRTTPTERRWRASRQQVCASCPVRRRCEYDESHAGETPAQTSEMLEQGGGRDG